MNLHLKNVTFTKQQLRDMAVNLKVCVCVCVLGLALRKGITVGVQLALRASIRPEFDSF